MPAPPLAQPAAAGFSPLLLADRLLTLAQEADRAGLADTAGRLVRLAHDVFDEPMGLPH